MLSSGAVTVMSLEKSREIRRKTPDRIITSRMVDSWKTIDDGVIAKSRWCAHGFKEPDIDELLRSSPTPQTESIYTAFQLLASRRWTASMVDIKASFNQSDKTTCKNPLYCSQPADGPLPGLYPEQLILLNTEVHGLWSGPW